MHCWGHRQATLHLIDELSKCVEFIELEKLCTTQDYLGHVELAFCLKVQRQL